MSEQRIENFISKIFSEDAQKGALDFISYLRKNEIVFERGEEYWSDKLYWRIKYKGEYVCFILINSTEDKTEAEGWTVWSDDSDSNWFADFPVGEHMKETAWKNVDFCANCGGCKNPGGTCKTVLGKKFDDVCITTMKFVNPDIETLEFMKKMVEIRKNDILKNI